MHTWSGRGVGTPDGDRGSARENRQPHGPRARPTPDVAPAAAGDGMLVAIRRGKTNPEGEARDVRFVKGDVAGAVRTLRAAASPGPEDRVVPLSPQMVGLRFQAAARAAGVELVTAHSAPVWRQS